jgi:hypothetical protein
MLRTLSKARQLQHDPLPCTIACFSRAGC